MHPLMMNISARKFQLSDQKCRRRYLWCGITICQYITSATHMQIALSYSKSRQTAPPVINFDSVTGFVGLYGISSQGDTEQTIGVFAVTSSHTDSLFAVILL